MRTEFILAVKANQSAFGLDLAGDTIERLADYYDLIQKHNPILHLVGPCSPEELAIRHILESLTLLEYLPPGVRLADVGAGAGLPSIPCLLVRHDLKAILIESKEKKARFLELAVERLQISDRATAVARQFQEVDPAGCQAVTCRALDRFTEKLPSLLKWSRRSQKFFFGGANLKAALQDQRINFIQKLIPLSDQRFLFVTSS